MAKDVMWSQALRFFSRLSHFLSLSSSSRNPPIGAVNASQAASQIDWLSRASSQGSVDSRELVEIGIPDKQNTVPLHLVNCRFLVSFVRQRRRQHLGFIHGHAIPAPIRHVKSVVNMAFGFFLTISLAALGFLCLHSAECDLGTPHDHSRNQHIFRR